MNQKIAYCCILCIFLQLLLSDISANASGINFVDDSSSSRGQFLRSGSSYNGTTASSHISSLAPNTVAVLITIDNWTKWPLLNTQVELTCGEIINKNGKNFPHFINPGTSEIILVEKKTGLTGVCGVLYWTVFISKDDMSVIVPEKICESLNCSSEHLAVKAFIMWSVPYNLNSYNAFFSLGLQNVSYFNQTMLAQQQSTSLFNQLYYGEQRENKFIRKAAGSMGEFQSEYVHLRGSLEPDTYTPIFNIAVLPLNDEHIFQGQIDQHGTKQMTRQLKNNATTFRTNLAAIYVIIIALSI